MPQNKPPSTAQSIARLMAHYWTGDEPEPVRRAQAEDWIDDLGSFSPRTVERACAEWRRTQTRRPVPAEIIRLCEEERSNQLARLPRPPDDQDTYARSIGWGSEAERRQAIAKAEQRRREFAEAATE